MNKLIWQLQAKIDLLLEIGNEETIPECLPGIKDDIDKLAQEIEKEIKGEVL